MVVVKQPPLNMEMEVAKELPLNMEMEVATKSRRGDKRCSFPTKLSFPNPSPFYSTNPSSPALRLCLNTYLFLYSILNENIVIN